ncbi:hypothetical protein JOD20_005143 [Herpetosiphon giganteus]|nr:hypothetical protein [Herpetosiphon giganteus]
MHNTNHDAYTKMVEGKLNTLDKLAKTEGWSAIQIMTQLDMLAADLRLYLRNLGGGVRVPQ